MGDAKVYIGGLPNDATSQEVSFMLALRFVCGGG